MHHHVRIFGFVLNFLVSSSVPFLAWQLCCLLNYLLPLTYFLCKLHIGLQIILLCSMQQPVVSQMCKKTPVTIFFLFTFFTLCFSVLVCSQPASAPPLFPALFFSLYFCLPLSLSLPLSRISLYFL